MIVELEADVNKDNLDALTDESSIFGAGSGIAIYGLGEAGNVSFQQTLAKVEGLFFIFSKHIMCMQAPRKYKGDIDPTKHYSHKYVSKVRRRRSRN